jgi:hypothetical protein
MLPTHACFAWIARIAAIARITEIARIAAIARIKEIARIAVEKCKSKVGL